MLSSAEPDKPDLPFKADIEHMTLQNTNYRKVLYTTKNLQLVLMSLLPKEEIGLEHHADSTQFIHIESGQGVITVNDESFAVTDGDIMIIPPDAEHNIINASDTHRLQLYTIYTPSEFPANTVEKTRTKKIGKDYSS